MQQWCAQYDQRRRPWQPQMRKVSRLGPIQFTWLKQFRWLKTIQHLSIPQRKKVSRLGPDIQNGRPD